MEGTLKNVKYLLENYPETRKNDHLLYVMYFEHVYNTSFDRDNFIKFRKSFESISRARRKIQELNPELIDEKQYEIRLEELGKYTSFYTQMSFSDL